jgi:hypothetical protein
LILLSSAENLKLRGGNKKPPTHGENVDRQHATAHLLQEAIRILPTLLTHHRYHHSTHQNLV